MSSNPIEVPKSTGNDRRRRTNRRQRKGGKSEVETKKVASTETSEVTAKKPKVVIVTAPLSNELVGKSVNGRISDIIRRGNGRFGFINLGDNLKPQEDTPRIYFRLSDYTDTDYPARRGYFVQFKVNADEENRFFASEVELTANGKVAAAEEKAARASNVEVKKEKKTTSAPSEPSAATKVDGAKADAGAKKDSDKKKRKKRQRKFDDTVLPLKVKFEGKEGVKDVSVKLGKPLGFLKRELATLFEEPGSFVMYCNITAENPKGEFLTKKLLKGSKDGDFIYLHASTEAEKAEA